MKIEFLKSDTNPRLIIIFAGWASGPSLYKGVEMPGWDVAVAYDYTTLDFPEDFLSSYHTVYLYAWSMGVWAASRVIDGSKITAAFAVNGTEFPADDLRGIPTEIFKGTADNLSESSLRKFRRRMCATKEDFEKVTGMAHKSDSIEDLRGELYSIMAQSDAPRKSNPLVWQRAYISQDDRIFPAGSQHRAWSEEDSRPEIVVLPGSHYVDLGSIVTSTLRDTAKVGRHFGRAAATYASHAEAQRRIAIRLANWLEAIRPNLPEHPKVLEIGPGTGLFTQYWLPMLRPSKVVFVDIASTPAVDGDIAAEHHIADAEVWLEEASEKFDLILSSSCIQWLTNLPRFFSNAHKALNNGGYLLASSFLPGNLGELDTYRAPLLKYRDVSELQKLLEPFAAVRIESGIERLVFDSPRSLLMHLRHTGVTGTGHQAQAGHIAAQAIIRADLRQLSYLPVYFEARR